ncbi:hypothetical protein LINGRAHAP2_LOCUS33612 [Linum grandiflorum]
MVFRFCFPVYPINIIIVTCWKVWVIWWGRQSGLTNVLNIRYVENLQELQSKLISRFQRQKEFTWTVCDRWLSTKISRHYVVIAAVLGIIVRAVIGIWVILFQLQKSRILLHYWYHVCRLLSGGAGRAMADCGEEAVASKNGRCIPNASAISVDLGKGKLNPVHLKNSIRGIPSANSVVYGGKLSRGGKSVTARPNLVGLSKTSRPATEAKLPKARSTPVTKVASVSSSSGLSSTQKMDVPMGGRVVRVPGAEIPKLKVTELSTPAPGKSAGSADAILVDEDVWEDTTEEQIGVPESHSYDYVEQEHVVAASPSV